MTQAALHNAKLQNGDPLTAQVIELGLLAEFPSGAGGTVTCKCIKIEDGKATFKSQNKNWPLEATVEIDAADFTLDEINELHEVIGRFQNFTARVTDEDRALMSRAVKMGLAHQLSYTQASWSDAGIQVFRKLRGYE